jgi:mannitol-specific phosphotransferase system IIBC component
MKTRIIILSFAVASLLISCNSDRDEEVRKDAIEQVKKSNQKIKFNPNKLEGREAETNVVKDSIIVKSLNGFDPANDLGESDDTEIIPPGDVRPPKK